MVYPIPVTLFISYYIWFHEADTIELNMVNIEERPILFHLLPVSIDLIDIFVIYVLKSELTPSDLPEKNVILFSDSLFQSMVTRTCYNSVFIFYLMMKQL